MTVATATARLAFDPRHGGATERDSQHASHAAHHARHNPSLLNDEQAARAKRDLVDRIARSTDRAERAALFREMHTLLARVRGAHVEQLDALENAARTATRRAAEQSVVAERTWPFPLYPGATLTALRERIEQEIGP
jgi:DNA polymerase III delta prime subunit